MKSNTNEALASLVRSPEIIGSLPSDLLQETVENPMTVIEQLRNSRYLFAKIETEEFQLRLREENLFERCGVRPIDGQTIESAMREHGISISRNSYLIGKFPVHEFSSLELHLDEVEAIVRKIKIGNFCGDLIPLDIVPWLRISLSQQPTDTIWSVASNKFCGGYTYALTNSFVFGKGKRLIVRGDEKFHSNEEVLFLLKPKKG